MSDTRERRTIEETNAIDSIHTSHQYYAADIKHGEIMVLFVVDLVV